MVFMNNVWNMVLNLMDISTTSCALQLICIAFWLISKPEVADKLHQIMYGIHEQCVKYGTEPDGYINYVKGANIAGFMKVAHAMMAQGIV